MHLKDKSIAVDLTNKVVLKLEISPCCGSMIVLSASPDENGLDHMIPVCDRCRAKLDMKVDGVSWVVIDRPSFVNAEKEEMEELAVEAAKGDTDLNICGTLLGAYRMVYTDQIDKEKLLALLKRAFSFGRRMSTTLIEYHNTFGERMVKYREEDIDRDSEKHLKQVERITHADESKSS